MKNINFIIASVLTIIFLISGITGLVCLIIIVFKYTMFISMLGQASLVCAFLMLMLIGNIDLGD